MRPLTITDLASPALGIVITRPAGGYDTVCMRCNRRVAVVALRSDGLAALDRHNDTEHPAWRREAAA